MFTLKSVPQTLMYLTYLLGIYRADGLLLSDVETIDYFLHINVLLLHSSCQHLARHSAY